MPKSDKETTMGGAKSRFETTRWSEIRDARTRDETRRNIIVDSLIGKYWKPVYCYLRRRGYPNEPAKDLTQGFFHKIVLGRELLQQADQTKGRFRTFLLTALDRYVVSVHRAETAKKRTPAGWMIQLDDAELPDLAVSEAEARPDQAFHYAWATDLLDEVLAEVKNECYSTGKTTHWEVFRAKVLDPIIENVEPPSLAEICTQHGIDSQSKASNMIVTVKRRFRTVLRRYLRQFVRSESQVEDELNELLEILSESGAG